MKNNTIKSKELLEQALKLMPRDFALSNARAYLNRAILEVSAVENKRNKKEELHKKIEENKEKQKLQVGLMTPKQQTVVLNNIDKLIEAEEMKLKELKNKKNENNTPIKRNITRPNQPLND